MRQRRTRWFASGWPKDPGIGMPVSARRSPASGALEAMGLVRFTASDAYLRTLTFDRGTRGDAADLQPDLPLVLHW